MDDYTDERIDALYQQTLDHLLIAPHAKEQLIQTQSKEKKWMMIQMNVHALSNPIFNH